MKNIEFIETNLKMPLMNLPVRTPIVSVDGKKIVISPGSKLTNDQLASLTNVTDIVAPNKFHTGGVKKASEAHSKAKRWISSFKLNNAKDGVVWTDELTIRNWPYNSELQLIPIDGMPSIQEVLFYHKDSKSLIVTDFCFNMTDAKGFGAWLILNLFGTYRKLGVSKFFLKHVKDRTAFENSLNKLFEFDFENIVVSHGENVIGGAKEKLKLALKEKGFNIK